MKKLFIKRYFLFFGVVLVLACPILCIPTIFITLNHLVIIIFLILFTPLFACYCLFTVDFHNYVEISKHGLIPQLYIAYYPLKGYCFVYQGECSKFYKTEKEVQANIDRRRRK